MTDKLQISRLYFLESDLAFSYHLLNLGAQNHPRSLDLSPDQDLGRRPQPSPGERGHQRSTRVTSPFRTGRFSGRGAQHPRADCSDGPRPALRCGPGKAPRDGGAGCRGVSAGRGGAGLEDPSCGEGGAAGASRPAWAEATTPLHHQPPPLARALFPHPPAALPGLGSSPASPLRLLPAALGPFRRTIGRRAGGSSAPCAPPALAPAPRAAPRLSPCARARASPERAWPPIKEAGRAHRRHYPLRSERRGAEAAEARRSLSSDPRPDAPTALTLQEPVRGGAGELGAGAGHRDCRPPGGEPGGPRGGAGPARGQVSRAGLAAPSDGREPGEPAATGLWRVGCRDLGAGGWNVIDGAEGGRGRRVPPRPFPQPGRGPARPHPAAAGGAGAPWWG